VPAHVVLHDRTLAALATLRPSSPEELLEVPGVGSVQVARFGASLLAVLAAPVPA
jgi:ATP-dependent DNA helicase RecQ